MIELDYSKCLYDVSKIPAGKKFLEVYPELSGYKEFKSASEAEIKIAILLSDINSPFLKIKDSVQRINSIFEAVGIEMNLKKNKAMLEDVKEYRHQKIFLICGVYLQLQNNHDFTYWWNLNQLYYSLMNEMGLPKENGEDTTSYVRRKLSIQKQAEPIKSDLLEVEANLFSDSKMKMAIARAKIIKIRTYAEMFAENNSVE